MFCQNLTYIVITSSCMKVLAFFAAAELIPVRTRLRSYFWGNSDVDFLFPTSRTLGPFHPFVQARAPITTQRHIISIVSCGFGRDMPLVHEGLAVTTFEVDWWSFWTCSNMCYAMCYAAGTDFFRVWGLVWGESEVNYRYLQQRIQVLLNRRMFIRLDHATWVAPVY